MPFMSNSLDNCGYNRYDEYTHVNACRLPFHKSCFINNNVSRDQSLMLFIALQCYREC